MRNYERNEYKKNKLPVSQSTLLKSNMHVASITIVKYSNSVLLGCNMLHVI